MSVSAEKKTFEMNYTYIVRCRDGSLYTGWTTDLDRRLAAHNQGTGAKYTKSRRPVELVYYESFDTKEEAMRREYEIKQLTRPEKLRLLQADAAAAGATVPEPGIPPQHENDPQ